MRDTGERGARWETQCGRQAEREAARERRGERDNDRARDRETKGVTVSAGITGRE